LDQAEIIYLVGEIGLVGLHCIGIPVGKIERSEEHLKEYDKLKQFMREILKKAALRHIKIYLPYQFIVSQKLYFEDSVIGNEA